jgi:hypothetical protein
VPLVETVCVTSPELVAALSVVGGGVAEVVSVVIVTLTLVVVGTDAD